MIREVGGFQCMKDHRGGRFELTERIRAKNAQTSNRI